MLCFLGCSHINNWQDIEKNNRHLASRLEGEFLRSNWESYLLNIHYQDSSLAEYQQKIAKEFMMMQSGGMAACSYYQWQLDKVKNDKRKLMIFEKTKDFTIKLDKQFEKAFGKTTKFNWYYNIKRKSL